MKALFALLSRLASLLTSWQNEQLERLDGSYQVALQRSDALAKRVANVEQINAQLVAQNEMLRNQRESLVQQRDEARTRVQRLENDLIQTQSEIARLSDFDAVRSDILGVSANGGHQ